MTNIEAPHIGGMTIDQWDQGWAPVDGGLTRYHPQLRHKVGLYRVLLGGQITALGTGVDKTGGLAKRLSDFRRPSPSSRRHYAGRRIHEHLHELGLEVLITGSGVQAREVALQLKTPMIRLHRPTWTVADAPLMRKG